LTRDKGLFHRAIGMSGSALLKWGTISQEESVQSSIDLARALGCSSSDPSAIVTCMRGKTTTSIVNALADYQTGEKNQGRLGFAPAAPSIQSSPPPGVVPFLNESPEAIFQRHAEANVPLIMGSVRHDGSFVLGVVYNQFLKYNGLQNNASFIKNELVHRCLSALGVESSATAEALAAAYLGEARNSGNLTLMLSGLTDLHTVFYFKDASFRTLQLHTQVQPQSYWYEFDFKGKNSVFSVMVNTKDNPVRGGITHGDDLTYLFNVPLMSLANAQEQAVSDRLVDYWANFAATGNPNVDENGRTTGQSRWLSHNEGSPSFASINAEDSYITEKPDKYWNGAAKELYPELY
jgi:acetylcholinesterase